MKTIISLLSLLLIVAACSQAHAVAVYEQTDSQQMFRKGAKLRAVAPPVQTPFVAFTDLISGPDTGLGDGLGSGVIVTVWGQKLGNAQGASTIEFIDSLGVARTPHVYYWKNADGQLPGGPANLYESHGMQEIAFSIPDGADGLGRIKIVVDGKEAVTFTSDENLSGYVQFMVRPGNIYHVKPGGNNANPCTFSQPCAFINGDINTSTAATNNGLGNARLAPGDIIYSHGVQEPTFTAGDGRSSGMYIRSTAGTLANQVALVAYPDNTDFSRITSQGYGVQPYLSSAINTSKYVISVGHADPTDPPNNGGNSIYSDAHIGASSNGRAVGNLLIQNTNTCFTGQAGAITSGGDGANNFYVLGNHIKELGCDNSSRYQHTIYLSVRNEASSITAPTIMYNRLDNNNVLNGLHIFDQSYTGDCGDMTGTLRVSYNVVVGQRGAGINIAANDYDPPINTCWSADIEVENNVLLAVGKGVAAEDNVTNPSAIVVGGGIASNTVKIRNNTVYGWGEDSSFSSGGSNQEGFGISYAFSLVDPVITIENNILVQTTNNQYVRWFNGTEPNVAIQNNLFWNAITRNGNNVAAYTNSIIADPMIILNGSQVAVRSLSPAASKLKAVQGRDIYGTLRDYESSIGAVEDVTSTLLLVENFDLQPDYMNNGKQSIPYIPAGWDSIRVDEEWHPSVEAGTQPAMYVNGNNPEQVYGGKGKSLVMSAESFDATDDNGWSSDGMWTKDFPEGHNEIYAKMNIKFQDGYGDLDFGSSKIFRIAHWDGVGSRYDFGTDGLSGPIYIWNWYKNSFGVRSQHAYRCDPQSTNYYCLAPGVTDLPREMSSGDISMNFVSDVAYLSPQIPDLLNGGFVSSDPDGIVEQRQIWGTEWHTLEWYVKMNSGPGVQDGVMSMWLDGQKIMHMQEIPWIGTNGEAGIKWNIVSIGGNDHHHSDLVGNPADREFWYSLDNIEIHNKLPENRQ